MNTFMNNAGLLLLASAFLAGPVSAAKPDDKGGNPNANSQSGNNKSKGKHDSKQMHYAGINQQDARKWAKQYNMGGYKPLPPGIRKNLARGKPIPPGIAKTRLPQGYINQLPRYEGYEWRGYGTDLVLVDLVSNVIADVIMDVLN